MHGGNIAAPDLKNLKRYSHEEFSQLVMVSNWACMVNLDYYYNSPQLVVTTKDQFHYLKGIVPIIKFLEI